MTARQRHGVQVVTLMIYITDSLAASRSTTFRPSRPRLRPPALRPLAIIQPDSNIATYETSTTH